MIREYMAVHCDHCVAALVDPTDEQALDDIAFRHIPQGPMVFFRSHAGISRVLREAGWYDDALLTLCADHYEAYLASFSTSE